MRFEFRSVRFARRASSFTAMLLDRRRRARSGVRLGFESLESRCLLNVANPSEETSGIDLFGAAATGSADGISTPSLAGGLSARAIGSATTSSSEGFGFGQSLLSDGTESQPNRDAVVKRGDIEYGFGTFNPARESELVKVQMVQAAFEFAEAGDVVTI